MMRVRACVYAWGSIDKRSAYQPAIQKIAGSIPTQDALVLLFPWARNFTCIAPVYPAAKWWTGEQPTQL